MPISKDYAEKLRSNPLFNDLNEEEFALLANALEEPKCYEAGEIIMREGDSADCFFEIVQGSVEVLKKDPDRDVQHRLTVLGTYDTVGELQLLDPGSRSATIQTLEATKLLVIPFSLLHSLSEGENTLETKIKLKLASTLGKRLRQTNETAVKSLMETLEQAKKRAVLGGLVAKVLLGTCLYIYVLGVIDSLALPSSSYVTVPLLIVWLGFIIHLVKFSGYPLEMYGITLKNWYPIALESLKFTLPAAVVVVLFKATLVYSIPAFYDLPVFDLSASMGMSDGQLVFAIAVYGLFVAPMEELLLRGGFQGSLQLLLTGQRKNIVAILLAGVAFSALHVHLSLSMALVTLPVALFWGWLYSRQGSVVGPAVSHMVLGVFAFFVVGLPIT